MLVQDQLTGQLHNVPDNAYGDAGYGYAYGNGLGFPPLLPIIGKLAPMVLPMIPNLINAFTGGGAQQQQQQPQEATYGDGNTQGYADVPPGQVVYDGFGNPLGFGPLMNVVRNILPGISNLIPGGAARPSLPVPRFPNLPMPSFAPPVATPFRPLLPFRIPPGWHRPPVPYTGVRPQRAYMRCAVWPGPTGLMPIAPGAPGAPGVPGAPVPGAPVMMRRRRRRRR